MPNGNGLGCSQLPASQQVKVNSNSLQLSILLVTGILGGVDGILSLRKPLSTRAPQRWTMYRNQNKKDGNTKRNNNDARCHTNYKYIYRSAHTHSLFFTHAVARLLEMCQSGLDNSVLLYLDPLVHVKFLSPLGTGKSNKDIMSPELP